MITFPLLRGPIIKAALLSALMTNLVLVGLKGNTPGLRDFALWLSTPAGVLAMRTASIHGNHFLSVVLIYQFLIGCFAF